MVTRPGSGGEVASFVRPTVQGAAALAAVDVGNPRWLFSPMSQTVKGGHPRYRIPSRSALGVVRSAFASFTMFSNAMFRSPLSTELTYVRWRSARYANSS